MWVTMIVAAAGLAIYLYGGGVPPAPIEAAHAAQPPAPTADRE
jgi:hypothetical protein